MSINNNWQVFCLLNCTILTLQANYIGLWMSGNDSASHHYCTFTGWQWCYAPEHLWLISSSYRRWTYRIESYYNLLRLLLSLSSPLRSWSSLRKPKRRFLFLTDITGFRLATQPRNRISCSLLTVKTDVQQDHAVFKFGELFQTCFYKATDIHGFMKNMFLWLQIFTALWKICFSGCRYLWLYGVSKNGHIWGYHEQRRWLGANEWSIVPFSRHNLVFDQFLDWISLMTGMEKVLDIEAYLAKCCSA